ncbi:hypothetical protein [Herbaspirillum lusitanum]|uniref:hypothetical protein n=1 Tax=Herbaspirillum lusitanum TaxID=213312 RepID=UPI0003143657|nr:hypothetical protein [Herbaspirillum lusitanum]
MKKITTVALLVLAGAMVCPPTFAATSQALTLIKANTAKSKAVAAAGVGKKKFLYLDMVQRKHPPSIRNAVIVYEHPGLKKQACDANDAKSVSECLRSPST